MILYSICNNKITRINAANFMMLKEHSETSDLNLE